MSRGFATLILILVMSAASSAADESGVTGARSPGARSPVRQASEVSSAGPRSLSAARMRYRRLNGRWWYWLPSEQWALWDDNQWTVEGQIIGQSTKVASLASRAPKQ